MNLPSARVDHLKRIAAYWDAESEHYSRSHPEHQNPRMHPSWGLSHVPESAIRLLAECFEPGCRMVDLGCGLGQDAVGFARQGADVIAVDVSREQLSRAIQHPHVNYILSAAERMPIDAGSIDIVVSDHGAFDHSPAALLLAEASRILKPGGTMAICTYSPLSFVCYDHRTKRIGYQLLNDYPSDLMKFDGTLVSTEMSYAGWIREFRANGFLVDRLEEIRPSENVFGYFDEMLDPAWAYRWPSDIAWIVRKCQARGL